MQGVTSTVIGEVVMVLLYSPGAHTATKYLSDKIVVRATRPNYKGKLDGDSLRALRTQVAVTIGDPNYTAREFIKQCKRAGEPFPIKKIQLKYPPKKK